MMTQRREARRGRGATIEEERGGQRDDGGEVRKRRKLE